MLPAAAGRPADWTEEVGCCPCCGHGDRRLLHADLTDQTFFSATPACSLYACNACGAAFLSPRLRSEFIGKAYARYYTHLAPARYLGDPASADPGLRFAVRRVAFARSYPDGSMRLESLPVAQRLTAMLALPFELRSLGEAMRGLPRGRPGDLLDVGFGDGGFLEMGALAGWRCLGVDVDPVAVANARTRGLNARLGSIHDLRREGESFDFISMSHTLEHVHDPRAEIRAAWWLLRPGGLLYMETPNIDSAGHRRYGRHWRGLEAPRHLVLFSWESLERMLNEVGFQVLRRIFKTQPFARLAAQSEAIARGADPTGASVRARHRALRLWAQLAVLLEPRRTEFITLLVQKCKP